MERYFENISKQMLTKELRELEKDGIISREIFAEIPPRVEYSITPLGETLFPIIDAMTEWGKKAK
jgi:DNA-binding HxlR family transcriptional regulator